MQTEMRMKKLRSVAFVLGVVLCLTAGAQNSQTRSTTIEPLPRDLPAAGATTHMQVFFDAAQAQAKGMPAGELKKLIQERFKTGHYKPLARAGLSYMLAPIMRTYDDPETSPKDWLRDTQSVATGLVH
jgi:hypothetical protein